MKNLFTLVVALLFAVPFVNAQITVTDFSVKKTYSYAETDPKPDAPSTTEYLFRDANGNPYLGFVAGGMRTVYTYNATGLKTRAEKYSANSLGVYELSTASEYTYDASGQLIKETSYNARNEITGYIEYSDFENGYYKNMKSFSKDGVTLTYWRAMEHTFDAGKLMTTVEFNCALDGSTRTTLDRISYTYNGDKCATAEMQYYTGQDGNGNDQFADASWIDTYTYSGDKLISIKSLTISRYGRNYQEDNFDYSTYAGTFVPKNFKAVEKSGVANVVELSWEAPESAVTGYMVIADGAMYNVTGNSYTTGVLKNGQHQFSVVAVNGSDIKNMSQIITLDLQDAGVKPATDFKVTAIGESEVDGNSTVYPVTVAWTAPETTSTITGYRVYYSEYSYESVAADQTSVQLKLPSWTCEKNGEDGIEGAPVTFWVVVEYETGNSEKSNQVTEIPYDGPESLGTETATVETVKIYPNPVADILYFSAPVSAELYNISGALVKSVKEASSMVVSDLVAGTYFVKTVNKAGAVVSNTVIIK